MSNANKIRNTIKKEMVRLNLTEVPIWSAVNGIPVKELSEKDIEGMVKFAISYNRWVIQTKKEEDKLLKIPVELLNIEYIQDYFPKELTIK